MYADWPDTQMRDAVAKTSLESVVPRVKWVVADKFGVQHGRSLIVLFSNGKQLSVRLDQGVTYWRVCSPTQNVRGFSTRFDFRNANIEAQAKLITGMNVLVEGGSMPTEMFVKVRDM